MRSKALLSVLSLPLLTVAALMTSACATSTNPTPTTTPSANNAQPTPVTAATAAPTSAKNKQAGVNPTTATPKVTKVAKAKAGSLKVASNKPNKANPTATTSTSTSASAVKTPAEKPTAVTTATATTTTAAKEIHPISKYVTAPTLNVRVRPTTDAEVVAKLARGSLIPVVVEGDWAKLGDHQYVLAKYLSSTRPTRAKEVAMSH